MQTVTQGGTAHILFHRSMRVSFSAALIGNVLYAACQWGIVAAIAKLGSPANVGQLSLGLAISGPVFMFTNLSLASVVATDVEQQFRLKSYVSVRLLTVFVAMCVIVMLTYMSKLRYVTVVTVLIISLSRALDAVSDLHFGFLRRNDRLDLIAVTLIVNGVCSLVASTGLLWRTHNIVAASLGYVIGSALALIIVLWFCYSKDAVSLPNTESLHIIDPPRNSVTIRTIILLSLPLGLSGTLSLLNVNIPRYFIQCFQNESILGYFSAIAYPLVASDTIINALGESSIVRLSAYYAMGRYSEFKGLMRKLSFTGLGIGLLGVAITAVLGKYILSILYKPDYAQWNAAFICLASVSVVKYYYVFFCTAFSAMRMFNMQFWLKLPGLLVMLLLSYIFIRNFGLMGAVWAVFASAIVDALSFAIGFNLKCSRIYKCSEEVQVSL